MSVHNYVKKGSRLPIDISRFTREFKLCASSFAKQYLKAIVSLVPSQSNTSKPLYLDRYYAQRRNDRHPSDDRHGPRHMQ